MRLIGLDIGTTGCKASVFDTQGNLLASSSQEYRVDIPLPGWAEQDAEHVWQLAQATLQAVVAQVGSDDIGAIGLSVQGEAVMPVDAHGSPLRPVILGMDTRTGEQNRQLLEKFGSKHLFELTGMPVHTINTLPKLLWIKQNEPEIWRQAHQFLLYEDFLIRKMTGRAVVSRCLASRTQMFDLHQDRWSDEILAFLELSPERLAEVRPSGTVVGELRRELAEPLGFKQAPLVVTGGHDQACGALGVGLVRPGLAEVSTGTAEVVEVALASPNVNQTLENGNISCYAHVAPGMYLAMTLNHSGGLILRWFRDMFCQEEKDLAAATGADAYDLIYQNASPAPSSLLLLPHFSGSGTPTFDTASKGAILGLTFATTKTDIAKAILEGLTFELRYNLDLLKAGGVKIDQLRAIGGGARSRLWLQLKADITGIPVVAPRITEAASWGAALLAGAGAGCFTDLIEATEQTVRLENRFEPDPDSAARYEERYHLYTQMYPALTSLNHSL